MAQQGNHLDINQLLGTVLQLRQRKDEMAQQEQMQMEQQRQAGLFQMLNMARNTADPTQATALARLGAAHGFGSESELISAFSEMTPSPEAISAHEYITGRNVLSGLPTPAPLSPEAADAYRKGAVNQIIGRGVGDQAGQEFTKGLLDTYGKNTTPDQQLSLSNIFAARSASGLTPGALSIDTATANLPGATKTRMAEIQGGTQVSAPQEANTALGYATLRSQNALGLMNNAVQEAEVRVRAMTGKAGGPTFDDIRQLQDSKSKLLKDIAEGAQKGMTPAQLQSYTYSLAAVNQLLNSAGIPTERIDPKKSLDVNTGFFQNLGLGAKAIGEGVGSYLQRPR